MRGGRLLYFSGFSCSFVVVFLFPIPFVFFCIVLHLFFHYCFLVFYCLFFCLLCIVLYYVLYCIMWCCIIIIIIIVIIIITLHFHTCLCTFSCTIAQQQRKLLHSYNNYHKWLPRLEMSFSSSVHSDMNLGDSVCLGSYSEVIKFSNAFWILGWYSEVRKETLGC